MKKLIEIQGNGPTIECDHCDFTEGLLERPATLDDLFPYLDQPCPECGYNLLTYEDMKNYLKMITIINWINKWFSWILFFVPKKYKNKDNVKMHSLHCVDNDIEIKEINNPK